MNDDPDEDSAGARARQDVEAQRLSNKIAIDETLAMTAEVE